VKTREFYRRFIQLTHGDTDSNFVLSDDRIIGIPRRRVKSTWEFTEQEEVRIAQRPSKHAWLKIGYTGFKLECIYRAMYVLQRRSVITVGLARKDSSQDNPILIVGNGKRIIAIAPAISINTHDDIVGMKDFFDKIPDALAVEQLRCAISDKS
jgi:hypothetical protein